MSTPDQWTLFWRDSEISKVITVGSAELAIHFSAASVTNHDGLSGYMPGVLLICTLSDVETPINTNDWVGSIREGHLTANDLHMRQMALPGEFCGLLAISFTLLNGTDIHLLAQQIRASLPTNPQWTESLAC